MAKLLGMLALKDDAYTGFESNIWYNPDIAPLPPKRRPWSHIDYFGFTAVSCLCITAWTASAALLSLGLTVGMTMGVGLVSKVFIALLAIGNGWLGAEWHVGFTVAQRVTLGMYGSFLGILIRIFLSVVWYANQAWLGGLCVTAMLSSWSFGFLNMRNTLPPSAHMVTRDFIGFVLFQMLSLPFMLIRPEKVRIPVAFANFFTTCAMIGITIRTCKEAGGLGPLMHKGADYSTLSPAWAWFYAITSTVGGISSGILNQSDYTRFAKKQGHQVPGTIIGLFLVGTLVPILSILTASASVEIYGKEPFWNPLTLVIQWLLDDYSPVNRAGAFFCSLAFVTSQLAENILGNGFAAGMDLAGLFPKYINMRRGCLLCAILSWVVQPWLFYNTASVFVAVMASFSVFLAPLTGIMLADYFIIRKQRIQLRQLYTGSEEGAYFYTGGVNWRAMVTWIVCFTPAIPGMVANLNPAVVVNEGIMNYYRGNYIFGLLEGATMYTALCYIFKIKGTGLEDDHDYYGTFDEEQIERRGITAWNGPKTNSEDEDENQVNRVTPAVVA
ncbi:hypothetical protein HYALB_00012500 [Hymenoscyphus albidus]|uniref:Thiamine transporter n=1 Tax=Hymenoscyphus albidus TaxID=595503 RepID=A0A9N9LRY3_9HELO|nr:hypothetical protein HYALB_00012500 [Hymenoscyphus albidus]